MQTPILHKSIKNLKPTNCITLTSKINKLICRKKKWSYWESEPELRWEEKCLEEWIFDAQESISIAATASASPGKCVSINQVKLNKKKSEIWGFFRESRERKRGKTLFFLLIFFTDDELMMHKYWSLSYFSLLYFSTATSAVLSHSLLVSLISFLNCFLFHSLLIKEK